MALPLRSDLGRGALTTVVATLVYVAGAAVARVWIFDADGIQPFWIATALATAVALAAGPRWRAFAIVGAMAGEVINAALFFEESGLDVIQVSAVNGLEVLIALALIGRVIDPADGIVRVRQSLLWMLSAAIAACAAAALATLTVLDGPDRLEHGLRWWVGDALGLVIVAPLGLLAKQRLVNRLDRAAIVEIAGLSIVLLACTVLAFSHDSPLAYVTLPFLVWLALRYGFRVATPAAIVITSWATVRTADGSGPFAADPGDTVLRVQAYNLAVGFTVLVMSALATRAEREREALLHEMAARQRLEDELSTVRSDERSRVSRRLHDDAIQVLVAADLQLAAARRRPDPATLDLVGEQIRLAIDELRDTISSISPTELDARSLGSSLGAVVDRFSAGPNAARFELGIEPVHDLSPAATHAIYLVGREAIANVARHARATTARVEVAEDDGRVTLTVSDDGVGLGDVDPVRGRAGHLGVRLMHERAIAAGAALTISSPPGGGTVVRLDVPTRPPVTGAPGAPAWRPQAVAVT